MLIASYPEILKEIMSFYGPCLSAVIILTLSVQTLRDHEERVHELRASGHAASGWEGDRYAEELQEELKELERDRYEHLPCACYLDFSPPFTATDREDAERSDTFRPEAGD